MELKLHNKEKDSDDLVIYHQNIMSLNRKGDEISVILVENLIRPHRICLSEHHIRKQETSNFSLSGYKLATSSFRKKFLKGGVCILVRNDIINHAVDLEESCNEKSLEICAIKLNISSTNFIVCCVYRSPSGNVNRFLKQLKGTLKGLYQQSVTFLICVGLNINFLVESLAKQKLETIMKTFSLTQVVSQLSYENIQQ
jgi:exonuclease III